MKNLLSAFFSCHKSSSIFIPEWFDVRLVARDGSTTTRVELTSQCSDPISSYPQVLSLKSWNFEFHNFFVENLVPKNDNKCRHLATVEYRKITQPFSEARRMSILNLRASRDSKGQKAKLCFRAIKSPVCSAIRSEVFQSICSARPFLSNFRTISILLGSFKYQEQSRFQDDSAYEVVD